MKKRLHKLGTILLTVTILWSCGKDDRPSTPTPTPEPEPTNAAPTMSAQNFEVPETITDAEEIGTVTADDDGDVLTFSIAENELFEITEAGSLSLKSGKALNFEAKPNYEVSVSVADSEGKTTSASITITVTDVAEADPEDKAAFVTTWQTDAANETIYIGLNNEYDYDFTINWGDGTVEDIAKAQDPENALYIAHEYAAADAHTVSIIGEFPAIRMYVIYPGNNLGLNLDPAPIVGYGLTGIEQWGTIQWQTMASAFAYATVLEDYNASDAPDLSQVTNMAAMFYLATAFNGDLSGWNVGNVEFMSFMFYGATAFNQDISGWTTDNVNNMYGMFQGATAFNQDVSGWNVGNVTEMVFMFNDATSFDQNLGGWNIGSVTTMGGMFHNSGMTHTSINATLIGWADFAAQNDGPKEIICGMEGITVCGPEAQDAGAYLQLNHLWSFPGVTTNDVCL